MEVPIIKELLALGVDGSTLIAVGIFYKVNQIFHALDKRLAIVEQIIDDE